MFFFVLTSRFKLLSRKRKRLRNTFSHVLHKISFSIAEFWATSMRSIALRAWTRKVRVFIKRNVCEYMRGQYVAGNRTGKSTRIARSDLVGISAKFGPEARYRAHERTCLLVPSTFLEVSLYELFLSGAIQDSVPETRVRYYRSACNFAP